MKKLLQYPFLILFALFIVGVSIIDAITPTRTHTEFESNLAQMPTYDSLGKFATALYEGDFQKDYESYLNDQFLGRNTWITLKSYAETALFKVENNNVIFSPDGQMFEKLGSYDPDKLQKNIESVQKFFADNPDLNTLFCLIPNANAVLTDKVPTGAPILDQEKEIANIYASLSNTVDLLPALSAHEDEYIYYRTDHHWTTLGAYYAYEALCEQLSLTPVDINTLTKHEVHDFYGTFFSKAKLFSAKPDVITYYDIAAQLELSQGVGTDGSFIIDSRHDTLYDLPKFETRDKYAALAFSNNPITIIHGNPNAEKDRLLIFKDSYGNSIVPFFAENYKEIIMVDLRYTYPQPVMHLEYDDAIILYNFSTFLSDTDVTKLKYSKMG